MASTSTLSASVLAEFPQFAGLAPTFAQKLVALDRGVKNAGGRITFPPGGGLRSTTRQAELRVINGCPDVHSSPASSCRVPTAIPGSSKHEKGLAYDIGGDKAIANRVAPSVGLHFPVRGEDWHVEEIDPSAPATAAGGLPPGWRFASREDYIRILDIDTANPSEVDQALLDAWAQLPRNHLITDGKDLVRADGSEAAGWSFNIPGVGRVGIPDLSDTGQRIIDAVNPIDDIVDFLRIIAAPELWLRIIAIGAGGIGVILGTVMITRDLGMQLPVPSLPLKK